MIGGQYFRDFWQSFETEVFGKRTAVKRNSKNVTLSLSLSHARTHARTHAHARPREL
jgi:hypothetical protein